MLSVVWAIFVGLLAAGAASDLRHYRIPNWVSASIVGLFLIVALLNPTLDFILPRLATAAAVFAVAYLLYALTGMGAGDAKLGTAIALWAGPSGLQAWLVLFAVAMLVLALVLIGLRRASARPAGAVAPATVLQRGAPVPLGLALSASAIVASFGFDPHLWVA